MNNKDFTVIKIGLIILCKMCLFLYLICLFSPFPEEAYVEQGEGPHVDGHQGGQQDDDLEGPAGTDHRHHASQVLSSGMLLLYLTSDSCEEAVCHIHAFNWPHVWCPG